MKNSLDSQSIEKILSSDNLDLKGLLDEMKTFNRDFGFIATFKNGVQQEVSELLDDYEYTEDIYALDRDYLVEKILNSQKILSEVWLKLISYRGGEFYKWKTLNASWAKFWVTIQDYDKFEDFLVNQTKSFRYKVLFFIYNVILDGLCAEDFSFQKWAIEYNQDLLEIISQIWDRRIDYGEDLKKLTQAFQAFILYPQYLTCVHIYEKSEYLELQSLDDLECEQDFLDFHEAWKNAFELLDYFVENIDDNINMKLLMTDVIQYLTDALASTNTVIENELKNNLDVLISKYSSQELRILQYFYNNLHKHGKKLCKIIEILEK